MPTFVLDARTATPHFPGIGRYVRSLAQAMAPELRRGERLAVLTGAGRPFQVRGTEAVPVTASPFSLAQQWSIPAQLRRLDAALYHSPYYLMPYRPGTRAVLTVYDLIPLRFPEHSTLRARLLFRGLTRLALSTARHVIAITETARRDFIAEFGLPPERITAIPLAPSPLFEPQPAAVIAAVREKYALPPRFVLYAGSNKPHKNLVGLVSAWTAPASLAEAADADLVIAGPWDERYGEARQLADAAGDASIRWLGRVPDADLAALYAAATVFVFPSLFEGFGLPVIEAMACGTPVICSNATALPEVAGDAAVLFDPGAPDAGATLRAALERVLGDAKLRQQLRERGLERAARFSWTETARQTLHLYRTIAGTDA